MTEPTHRRPEPEHPRPTTRAARYPHEPERLPDRAGRFLGLLDRSRREGRAASA